MRIKAILLGFGNVGRELFKEILRSRDVLGVDIIAVFSSRGGVVVKDDEDLRMLYELATNGFKLNHHPNFIYDLTFRDIITTDEVSLAYIAIPPNYINGEPNRSIYYSLIDHGVSIITADKTVLAMGFNKFLESALRRGAYIGYRATVAAGVPFTDIAKGLRGRDVTEFKAILNVTTNYILNLMESGLSYREAVNKAIEVKVAEPDPRVDTEGWDLAAKLSILSSIITGRDITIDLVKREPLSNVGRDYVVNAVKKGYRVRYIGTANLRSMKFYVGPQYIDISDPLARLKALYSGAKFIVENEELVVIGPAGPAWRTAKVMITDTLEFKEHVKHTK